jgi:tryptophanyl-tRNA synthetase
VLISPTPKILGLDGKAKMSKSLNNTIGMLETPEVIWEKLRTAVTDVHRVRRSDLGQPEECNIFTLHQAFSPPDVVQFIRRGCETAGIGCVDCKKELFKHMMEELAPIQDKARALREDPRPVREALVRGAERCRQIAVEVMDEVRDRIGVLTLERLRADAGSQESVGL